MSEVRHHNGSQWHMGTAEACSKCRPAPAPAPKPKFKPEPKPASTDGDDE